MDVGYGLNKDNFILKLPAEGYHAYDGKVKVFNEKILTRYFTLIQNSAHFLCLRSAHFYTKNSLSFGQVNTALVESY